MSSVKERLQQFLKAERITASEFARKMELSPAYLASMRKSMPPEKVEKLTQIFPQLNRDWLLYGEGNMYRDDIAEKGIEPYRLDRHLVPLVPVHAAAGSFPMYAEGVLPEGCKRIFSPIQGAELAIMVKGDSMEPQIQDGTYLFIRKINDKSFIPWGTPLVLDTENGSVCKMIFPSSKGEEFVEARSFNPAYPPFTIPLQSVYGIYRILAEVKEGWTL
ncbi:MAG: LexA family transcriptional regulator [Muribaculaceae bacterium]|nr:LexA family transcriptional regulator [Muribaculaceae bacterium]